MNAVTQNNHVQPSFYQQTSSLGQENKTYFIIHIKALEKSKENTFLYQSARITNEKTYVLSSNFFPAQENKKKTYFISRRRKKGKHIFILSRC